MEHTLDHILGPNGPVEQELASRGLSYESRPEQIMMARAVERAMAAKSHLLVEAGTGVGKSFAYLVPAIARCLNHNETVVIATNTIALQEQLMEKDTPLLTSTIPPDRDDAQPWSGRLKAVLVKGRGNYLSIRRLKLASERQDKLLPEAASKRSLHVIEDWAYLTSEGTRSTLPELERPAVWDRVRSDSGNCMGRKCPTYSQCFYQSARREMESANLLICNHALFFSDLALRARGAGLLPRYDHVVLDEAHGVEDVAADHFGLSLSEWRVKHLLSTLYHPKTRKGYLPQLTLQSDDPELVDRLTGLVLQAESISDRFFESVQHVVEQANSKNGRLREPNLVNNILSPVFNELAIGLRRLKDTASRDADRLELNAYAQRSDEVAEVAEALVSQSVPNSVYWASVGRGDGTGTSKGRPRITMACSPIEVGALLKEHLFERDQSVILTSATLATRRISDGESTEQAETAFAHTMDRLGCEGADTLQLGSPFDYTRQVELFIDQSMPSPKQAGQSGRNAKSYSQELSSRVLDHIIATEGGAFVLFTSFRSLNEVADRLRGPLDELGYPLLCQGKDGPRGELLRSFRQQPSSVLFGAASFWQGVDVRGESLRNVIITRLPFEPPDRPLTEARLERIEARGGNPFREDSLPRAVIRFKQGFGRLIRSESDSGRVVVLDPRIMTTGYGRKFLDALPDGIVPQTITE